MSDVDGFRLVDERVGVLQAQVSELAHMIYTLQKTRSDGQYDRKLKKRIGLIISDMSIIAQQLGKAMEEMDDGETERTAQ